MFLKTSEHDFIQRSTRLNAQRNGLSLAEKTNGECIFLDGNNCRINAVKPQQCRDFPNLWNFPGFEKICQAKPVVLEAAAYQHAILEATGRDLTPQPT